MPAKPNYAPVANTTSAQWTNLLFWGACGTGGGAVTDPIIPTTLLYAVPTSNITSIVGPAMNATALGSGCRVAAPAGVQGLLPVTLMCVFYQQAAPTAFGSYLSVTADSTDLAPFIQYSISVEATPLLQLEYNTAGSRVAVVSTVVPANGAVHVAIFTLANGAQNLYLDGVLVASATAAASAATHVNTPVLGIGIKTSDTDATRDSGAYILDARIYNAALTTAQVSAFTQQWDDLYAQPFVRRGGPQRSRTPYYPLLGV